MLVLGESRSALHCRCAAALAMALVLAGARAADGPVSQTATFGKPAGMALPSPTPPSAPAPPPRPIAPSAPAAPPPSANLGIPQSIAETLPPVEVPAVPLPLPRPMAPSVPAAPPPSARLGIPQSIAETLPSVEVPAAPLPLPRPKESAPIAVDVPRIVPLEVKTAPPAERSPAAVTSGLRRPALDTYCSGGAAMIDALFVIPRPSWLAPVRMSDATVAQPKAPDEQAGTTLRLTPPTPALLFRLESEASLRARIRKEAEANPKLPRPEFPKEAAGGPGVVTPRQWPWITRAVEPTYLCYGRLYFQQTAFERFGLNAGVAQPLLSAGLFYADLLALPMRVMFWPCQPYECSSDGYSPFFDGWPRQR